jgi:hypothetical protein
MTASFPPGAVPSPGPGPRESNDLDPVTVTVTVTVIRAGEVVASPREMQ